MMKTAIQIRSETHARLVRRLLEQNHIAFESRKKPPPQAVLLFSA